MEEKENPLKKLWYKVRDLELEDVFPLNKGVYDIKDVLKRCGIYLGAIIVALLLGILLGPIFILGVIIWIIAGAVILYATVGLIILAFKFMQFN
ncbi:MAG: hypothetical protein IJ737_01220 [Ruminococcus sp.]|nr:hypothetical protein [Ruminococcus sp.]